MGELRAAVDAHPAITWNDSFANACGQSGVVLRDDLSDGTSEVSFAPPIGFVAWLPTSQLTDLDDGAVGDGKDGAETEPTVLADDAAAEDAAAVGDGNGNAEEETPAPAEDSAAADTASEGSE